jgi:hypothetical protein
MKDTLFFRYRDDFLRDGYSQSNKCIQNIANNKHGHDWRGPLVVLKLKRTNIQDNQSYKDIQQYDFPDIIDFFLYYENK